MSKTDKRNHGHDDKLLAAYQDLIARLADNNISNEDHSDHAEASDNGNWIGCWIHKPEGERGHKSQDGCQGWGKLEILEMAGITEEQYGMYLVRVSITLAVQLTGSFT